MPINSNWHQPAAHNRDFSLEEAFPALRTDDTPTAADFPSLGATSSHSQQPSWGSTQASGGSSGWVARASGGSGVSAPMNDSRQQAYTRYM